MKEFWNMTQLAFAAVGGGLGWFLGGCDRFRSPPPDGFSGFAAYL